MSWALSLRQFYAKRGGGGEEIMQIKQFIFFVCLFLWPQSCGILVLQRGMELMPPVVEAES